jgi:Zn-dependent M28 family amino/carboxypeptidase
MHGTKIFLIPLLLGTLAGRAVAAEFSGAQALEFTRAAVAFGARPSGSPAIRKLQAYILAQLKLQRCAVIQDDFTASTPLGQTPMKNIIARFPGAATGGASATAVVFTGHYDTKSMPGRNFVGANDGGSSTGLLLEMARVLEKSSYASDVFLVWLDGEEAVAQWTDTDSLYGSRHLAARWGAEGFLDRIKLLINVDMIGDKNLGILREEESSQNLRMLVWDTAKRLGFGQHFLDESISIADDHLPFLRRGVNALDLIDFDYGPGNAYWHTEKDTMDKLSADSFSVVGKVLLKVLEAMDGRDRSR